MSDTIVRNHTQQSKLEKSHGRIFAIGGAEDKEGDEEVLRAFVELAGGKGARIALIPSASEEPEDAVKTYREAFSRIGIASFQVVHGTSADEIDTDEHIAILSDATGIFMSGGDQSVLAERICGTRVADCLKQRNVEGIVVGGTSAGAAILASHMVDGGEGGSTPKRSMSTVSQGLGLLRNVIVDTHFGSRGRTGRLMAMHAAHPEVIAIGLDEDTAAVIDDDMVMRVVGSGAITIVDGSSIRSDLDRCEEDEPLMISGVEMHTVTKDYTFDIRARHFVPPLRQCYTQ